MAEISGFLSIHLWIKSSSSSMLGEDVQEAKMSQSGVKALLRGSKGQFFSIVGKSGFVTQNKHVVDLNRETGWENMLWLCYAENFL